MLSPSRKRACVDHVRSHLDVSERRACAVVGQPRATQRRPVKMPDDEAAFTAAIERLASRYGRYGYRRIREMLVAEGWWVNVKRIIGSAPGRAESAKQTTKTGPLVAQRRICLRLGPHVQTTSGRMTLSRIARKTVAPSACWSCSTSSRAAALPSSWRDAQVRRRAPVLADLFATHGPPEHLRSDERPRVWATGFVTGSAGSASRRSTSSRGERLGRMATARASTQSSETSC